MCFSLGWIENVLIALVIIGAVVAILKLVVPWALSIFGIDGGIILQIINIVVFAVIAIFVIIFAFDLISCLLHAGSLRLSGIDMALS